MKKLFLLTMGALMSAVLWASPRSLQQARMAAPGMRHVHTMKVHGEPVMYVFDRPNEGGYLLISADDRAYTVLGYTDRGHWDANDIPANAQAWLEMLSDELLGIRTDASAAEEAPTYTPVAPLCTTQWSQKSPYNDLCPMWQNKHSATGCVALAAAQIMKKHNYPTQGIGSHSYKWANENGDSIELSADFANTTYAWSSMLDQYDNTATDVQKNAVATLVYHCGVADELNYGRSTGGNSHHMVMNLIDHFGYDKRIRTYRKNYQPDSLIMPEIASNLQNGRPIYVSAKTEEGGGHAFVCDGMDANGLLHINWGWGGKSDGYYRLSVFAPQQQGTGGSASNKAYTQDIRLYTRIRPNANGDYYSSFSCENIHPQLPVYHRDSAVRFVVDTFYNGGFTEWTGGLGIFIYKDGAQYKARTSKDYTPLRAGVYRQRMSFAPYFTNREDYPEGTYEVEVAVRVGESKAAPLYCKNIGRWKCQMTITADSIYIVEPTATMPEPEPEPTESFEQVRTEKPQVEKILRDGILYIRRNGKEYTIL